MIYEIAGFLGVDPDNFTLRQLLWMEKGREAKTWWHTAQICATIANSQREKKKKAFTPEDFYPKTQQKRRKAPDAQVPITVLKQVFVDGNFTG